jgi:hypothetical protein
MTNQERAKKYKEDIRKAIKQFGEYNFYDKNCHEVMDLPIHELQELTVDDVAETLLLVSKNKAGMKFVSDVIVSMDDWNKFDDLLDKHTWLKEFY